MHHICRCKPFSRLKTFPRYSKWFIDVWNLVSSHYRNSTETIDLFDLVLPVSITSVFQELHTILSLPLTLRLRTLM